MVLLGIHDNKINFKTTTFHFSDYFESGSKYSNYNIQQNENMLDTARGYCQCLGGTLLAVTPVFIEEVVVWRTFHTSDLF